MLTSGEGFVTRPTMKTAETGGAGGHMAKNQFYALLGDCYTIVVSTLYIYMYTRGATNKRALVGKRVGSTHTQHQYIYMLKVLDIYDG